ncbi:MAG: S1 domain-containing RNA-binding protein [Sarcina sp.]
MTLEAGNILEGKVTNITNFGAFVEVEGETGLVHISEVADSFVKDIREHLKENDVVKVKVLSVDDRGKISLSIKQAMPPKRKSVRPAEVDWSNNNNNNNNNNNYNKRKPQAANNFEDIMSKFLKDSEERMQDVKKNQEPRSKNRRSLG